MKMMMMLMMRQCRTRQACLHHSQSRQQCSCLHLQSCYLLQARCCWQLTACDLGCEIVMGIVTSICDLCRDERIDCWCSSYCVGSSRDCGCDCVIEILIWNETWTLI